MDQEELEALTDTDVVYHVTHSNGEESFFFTPDGIGHVFFESLDEALEETGLENIVHVHHRRIH